MGRGSCYPRIRKAIWQGRKGVKKNPLQVLLATVHGRVREAEKKTTLALAVLSMPEVVVAETAKDLFAILHRKTIPVAGPLASVELVQGEPSTVVLCPVDSALSLLGDPVLSKAVPMSCTNRILLVLEQSAAGEIHAVHSFVRGVVPAVAEPEAELVVGGTSKLGVSDERQALGFQLAIHAEELPLLVGFAIPCGTDVVWLVLLHLITVVILDSLPSNTTTYSRRGEKKSKEDINTWVTSAFHFQP